MEDQQPDAGDLTDAADTAGDAEVTARTPRGKSRRAAKSEPEAADSEPGEPEEPDESRAADEPDETPRQRVEFVERTRPGRFAVAAIAVAAGLFIAAGGYAGAMAQPYLTERAEVHSRVDVARTAANAIATLWTYTPEDMEQLGERASQFLAGDFADEYRKYIDAIVPANKQAQVSNYTEVVGAAVESLRGEDATAIVYTNSTSTTPLNKNVPSLRYVSYRVELKREGADWRVIKMSSITSLNLAANS